METNKKTLCLQLTYEAVKITHHNFRDFIGKTDFDKFKKK